MLRENRVPPSLFNEKARNVTKEDQCKTRSDPGRARASPRRGGAVTAAAEPPGEHRAGREDGRRLCVPAELIVSSGGEDTRITAGREGTTDDTGLCLRADTTLI